MPSKKSLMLLQLFLLPPDKWGLPRETQVLTAHLNIVSMHHEQSQSMMQMHGRAQMKKHHHQWLQAQTKSELRCTVTMHFTLPTHSVSERRLGGNSASRLRWDCHKGSLAAGRLAKLRTTIISPAQSTVLYYPSMRPSPSRPLETALA